MFSFTGSRYHYFFGTNKKEDTCSSAAAHPHITDRNELCDCLCDIVSTLDNILNSIFVLEPQSAGTEVYVEPPIYTMYETYYLDTYSVPLEELSPSYDDFDDNIDYDLYSKPSLLDLIKPSNITPTEKTDVNTFPISVTVTEISPNVTALTNIINQNNISNTTEETQSHDFDASITPVNPFETVEITEAPNCNIINLANQETVDTSNQPLKVSLYTNGANNHEILTSTAIDDTYPTAYKMPSDDELLALTYNVMKEFKAGRTLAESFSWVFGKLIDKVGLQGVTKINDLLADVKARNALKESENKLKKCNGSRMLCLLGYYEN